MPTIFETTEFDFETLRARFQQMAFLNKGLRITLTDERRARGGTVRRTTTWTWTASPPKAKSPPNHHTVVYQYDDGLLDYVKHLNSGKKVDVVHEDVIAFETEDTERQDRPGNGDAVDQRVLRERPHLRQHHQHP